MGRFGLESFLSVAPLVGFRVFFIYGGFFLFGLFEIMLCMGAGLFFILGGGF